jgi:hypothetical protein
VSIEFARIENEVTGAEVHHSYMEMAARIARDTAPPDELPFTQACDEPAEP